MYLCEITLYLPSKYDLDNKYNENKLIMLKKVYYFYRDGFRSMKVGRTLWLIIIIKLFIMFAILKVFFFPSQLGGMTPEEKANTVRENLININK